MKHVLIFTYYFPPAGGVAVQRWLKFTKYLPENGWLPIVVTVKDGSYPYLDESLEKEIDPHLEVHKTETFEPFEIYNLLRGKKGKQLPTAMLDNASDKSVFQKAAEFVRANFFIPDARKGWVKYAVSEGVKIIQSKKIDAIVTTGPPHSTHLIGMMLQKQFGVKWIADFRDPWTSIFTNTFLPRTDWAKQQDKHLETEVLKRADCVTVIGPSMQKEFQDRAKRIEVIWNGFDEADIAVANEVVRNPVFTIRYVGNLFASQTVPAFWKAVARLRKEENAKLKIEFTGRVDESVKQLIRQSGVEDVVSYNDFVPHNEAVQLMCSADALLFAIPAVPDSERIITGKIFEYLATKKPILAFGPLSGDAAKLLVECGRETMCDFEDNASAFAQLKLHYQNFAQQTPVAYNNTYQKFSRKNQAEVLVKVMNELS